MVSIRSSSGDPGAVRLYSFARDNDVSATLYSRDDRVSGFLTLLLLNMIMLGSAFLGGFMKIRRTQAMV